MSDELLEECIRQYIQSQRVPEVTITWQGGEPTLMGLDFFRRSVEYAENYKWSGMTIHHTIQTNGTLLNDEWCSFFRKHGFLVGISLEVYRFFRDKLGAQFIQFIPIVERDNTTGFQEGNRVTERSVGAKQYGNFLISIFDEWVRRDVGRIFVQIFDVSLAAWVGAPPGLCIFAPTCGTALVMEHNGDVYSCDHFVEPRYLQGNIREQPLIELVASEKQRKFGMDKRNTLPQYCHQCPVRFVCHGGCPKNRFIETQDGEPGLNYLCAGYKAFFMHIDLPMRTMASLLQQNRAPAEIMGTSQNTGRFRYNAERICNK